MDDISAVFIYDRKKLPSIPVFPMEDIEFKKP